MRGRSPGSDRDSAPPEVLEAQFRSIIDRIAANSADDLNRQLPKLVDTVVSVTDAEEETVRFWIGVSFSRQKDPFDYRLDEIRRTGSERVEVVQHKTPVTDDHHYLSFPYPADPEFDASSLRGALLATLERVAVQRARERDRAANNSLAKVWDLLERPSQGDTFL